MMRCTYCAELTLNRLFALRKDRRGEFCGSLYGFESGVANFYRHQPSYSALVDSANAGCDFCAALAPEFRRPDSEHVNFNREGYIAARVADGIETEIQICLACSELPNDKSEAPCFDLLCVRAGSPPPFPEFPSINLKLSAPRELAASLEGCQVGRYNIDPDLGADANFEVARGWLRTCATQHAPSACPSIADTSLPTRVIDVSSDPPFLLVSGGRQGAYLALSHCWGGPLSLTTTYDTLDSHQKGIPMNDMPANFRDAVIITRKLGFRYVWIDALCITQDCREDWELEAAKMCDIYQKAAVTIAAATAKDSTVGILKDRLTKPSELDSPASIKFIHENGQASDVSVTRMNAKEERWYSCNVWVSLADRGWTLQEQYLSPRFLSYGSRQIYWRCAQASLSADGAPEYGPSENTLFLNSLPALPQPISKLKPYRADNLYEIYKKWHALVGTYCARKLTVKSDKLPALAGLATHTYAITGDDYLAGIWRGDLNRGLLWFYNPPRLVNGELPIPERLSAPSWSWAKLHGPIGHIGHHERPITTSVDVEYIDHAIVPAGRNPYGEVKSGRLTLRGSIHHSAWEERSFQLCETYWDIGVAPHNDIGGSHYLTAASEAMSSTKIVYTFFLISFSIYYKGSLCPHVLILLPVPGQENTYQRIGCVWLNGKFLMTASAALRTWSDWPRQTISLI